MKFKALFSLCLALGAFSASAQSHVEGVEYYKADQFGNAKELLERNYNNPSTDKSVADYYLGLIALQEKNLDKAASYFEKGIQGNPDYGFNYVGQGQLALLKGETKEAERLFKLGESKAKKDPAMEIAIANAYYNVNPTLYAKEIDKRLEKARRIKIDAPAIFIFEGDVLADQKDWGGAGSKYEMATTYDPNATEAYVKYANLFTQVNPQYAINMLRKLLQLNPNSALGQRELANAYYNGKDFANAAKEYGKYVANPNHFKQDEDRYAFLLFYGGDYQKGYDYASALLKADANNFTARRYQFMNAAQIPALQNELLPMAEALYSAHKANPKNTFAPIDFTLIADEFSRAKRYQDAVAVLEEGMKEIPDNANFNKQLAMTYVDESDFAKAAEAYKGYIKKLDEPGYNDYVQQALFSYFAGIDKKDEPQIAAAQFDDAIAYAKKASEILPTNYKPKKILGDVAKMRASKADVEKAAAPMYLEAVALLEQAPDTSRYKSDAKEMYNYLGNYYLDQKDIAKAKGYFNKYLEYDPDNQEYRKFVNSLK